VENHNVGLTPPSSGSPAMKVTLLLNSCWKGCDDGRSGSLSSSRNHNNNSYDKITTRSDWLTRVFYESTKHGDDIFF